MVKEKKYYIYALLHPNSNVVRYIGKTTNINARLWAHVYLLEGSKKDIWIYSLLRKNQKPIIKVLEECTEKNWHERESFYIRKYKRKYKRPHLLNSYKGIRKRVTNSELKTETKKMLLEGTYYRVAGELKNGTSAKFIVKLKEDLYLGIYGGRHTQNGYHYVFYKNKKFVIPKQCSIYKSYRKPLPILKTGGLTYSRTAQTYVYKENLETIS